MAVGTFDNENSPYGWKECQCSQIPCSSVLDNATAVAYVHLQLVTWESNCYMELDCPLGGFHKLIPIHFPVFESLVIPVPVQHRIQFLEERSTLLWDWKVAKCKTFRQLKYEKVYCTRKIQETFFFTCTFSIYIFHMQQHPTKFFILRCTLY